MVLYSDIYTEVYPLAVIATVPLLVVALIACNIIENNLNNLIVSEKMKMMISVFFYFFAATGLAALFFRIFSTYLYLPDKLGWFFIVSAIFLGVFRRACKK